MSVFPDAVGSAEAAAGRGVALSTPVDLIASTPVDLIASARDRDRQFAEVQALAHVGSWELDPDGP